jgi:SAM-dependent methyltransferase
MLDRLQENGWETWGIEPSVGDAFPRHGRLTAVPPEPSFDLIIAHHVLEHVADPLTLLHLFARAARPGAYLSVGVPRFDTLPDHRDYKYVINGHSHITAYTWPCLQGLLARSGWQPVGSPPDRIRKANGRLSSARIRIIARRVQTALELPAWPASAARLAMRRYHASSPFRFLARLQLLRLSARQAERRRQRDIQSRKAQKREHTAPECRP